MRRNLLRTALVYVALFVLTGMLTLIYTFVSGLDKMTADKEGQAVGDPDGEVQHPQP